ncbi:hypothetical protein DFJ77DRAFT_474049 [Powellomyces hirtus]|nr:hypothetical protein DFJ77DRAFT_474049 [Powellomyces hirtus]
MRTIVGRTYYLTVQSDTEFDVRTDHISICASEQLFHALQRAYQNRATLEPARAEEFMGMLDPRVKGWLKAMRRKDVGEEMPSASPDPYSDQQRNMCREHTPPNQPRNATHLATDTPCPQPVGQMHRKQVAQGHDAPFRQHELESFLNMLALPLSPEPTPSPSKKVLNKFGQKGKSVFPAGSDSQNDQEAPWEPDYDLTPHLPCGPAPHSGSFFSVSPASTGSLEKHYSHHVARVSSLFALEFASLNKIESEAQALRAQHQGLCALLPSYVFDDARGDVSKIKAKRTYSQRERLLIKEVKELEWRTRECDDEFKREYARVEGLLKTLNNVLCTHSGTSALHPGICFFDI